MPDVRQRLLDQGFVVIGGSAAEFASVIAKDTQKFAEVISKAGINAN